MPPPATPPERRAPSWLLPALMLGGAVAGMLVGGLLGARWRSPELEPLVVALRLAGQVFLSLLKALVVPLVVTSIIVAVSRMGDLRRVGRVAGFTVFYFLSTTFFAVLTGLVLVNVIRPGASGAAIPPPSSVPAAATRSTAEAIAELVSSMFPANLAAAAAEGNVLGLVVFSLIFGVALALEGERTGVLGDALDVANRALLRIVRAVVWLAPLGILGLVADRTGRAGGGAAVFEELSRLGWYATAVLSGLAVHALVTLPLLLFLLTRRSPARYAAGMFDSLLTAFGTASSAATLAVTLRCVVSNNRVSRKAADFVIPLGTTVNMDGTALYEAVAVLFIAQTLGVELTVLQQVAVLITATLAAIGAAAIPEAGLVTMVLVLSAVGLPAEAVGLLLSIDWILDRFRTAVNVWGDAVGAAVVERRLPATTGDGNAPPLP